MKIQVLLFLVICPNLFCNTEKEADCIQFKTGRLLLHSEINNLTYLITRNDTKQLEEELETGKKSEWKINWISECEYKLTLVKDNYGLLNSGEFIPSYTYKIIRTTKDYYIFEGMLESSVPIFSDTIFKIKKVPSKQLTSRE